MITASFVAMAWICFLIVAFENLYTYLVKTGLVGRNNDENDNSG